MCAKHDSTLLTVHVQRQFIVLKTRIVLSAVNRHTVLCAGGIHTTESILYTGIQVRLFLAVAN